MTIPQIMAQASALSLGERQALIALLQESIHPEPIPQSIVFWNWRGWGQTFGKALMPKNMSTNSVANGMSAQEAPCCFTGHPPIGFGYRPIDLLY